MARGMRFRPERELRQAVGKHSSANRALIAAALPNAEKQGAAGNFKGGFAFTAGSALGSDSAGGGSGLCRVAPVGAGVRCTTPREQRDRSEMLSSFRNPVRRALELALFVRPGPRQRRDAPTRIERGSPTEMTPARRRCPAGRGQARQRTLGQHDRHTFEGAYGR